MVALACPAESPLVTFQNNELLGHFELAGPSVYLMPKSSSKTPESGAVS